MALTDNDSSAAFFNRIANHPILTADEEKRLARRVQAGDLAAREEMIRCNMRLVISIALPFRARAHKHDLELDDLVQEGVIGLNRAVDKFDPERGFKFSTYATWWIRQAVQRAVANKGSTIRTPVHVHDRRHRIRRYLDSNPDASEQEVAEALDLEPHQLRAVLDAPASPLSLDMEYGSEEDGSAFGASLEDPNSPDPSAIVAHEAGLDPIREAVHDLPEPMRSVIRLRFGFDGPVRSISDVSDELGIPGHRVSALQREGIRKLRRDLEPDRELLTV